MTIATLTAGGKKFYFKRVGSCTRCGFCCRMDTMNPEQFRKNDAESRLETGEPYDPRCDWLYLDKTTDPQGIPACKLYHIEHTRPDGSGTGEFFDGRRLFCKKWPESPGDPRYLRLFNYCGYRFLQCDKDGNIYPGQESGVQPGVDVILDGGEELPERPPLDAPGYRRSTVDK